MASWAKKFEGKGAWGKGTRICKLLTDNREIFNRKKIGCSKFQALLKIAFSSLAARISGGARQDSQVGSGVESSCKRTLAHKMHVQWVEILLVLGA